MPVSGMGVNLGRIQETTYPDSGMGTGMGIVSGIGIGIVMMMTNHIGRWHGQRHGP